MSFSVSLNPALPALFYAFFAAGPDVSPQLAGDLLRDFELYNRYGLKPDYFGRGCRYDRHESIISYEIYHIYLDLVSTNLSALYRPRTDLTHQTVTISRQSNACP